MLEVRNLHANVDGTDILRGLNLTVKPGEVHAVMGPNGSGKSTLSKVISGHEDYEVTEGDILLDGKSILELEPDERACEGLFMAFQYPVEIPGVNNAYFMRTALNSIRKYREEEEISPGDFLKLVREKMGLLEMDQGFLRRALNEGFSGGEKKRNEVLQMLVLEPKLAILDETDSGLDIDALKVVAKGVNELRSENRAVVVITHYQRLLNYIVPDFTHVLVNGQIVKSGGKELALQLEERGYGWIHEEVAAR